jgi:hypothetical protein
MVIPLAVVLPLATQLVITVADTVPTLDVRPSCEAAAKADPMIRKDVQSCLDSEQRARDELVKQWSGFATADRARCLDEVKIGGSPSYAEFVTCLEMARDAKKLDKNEISMGRAPDATGNGRKR